MALYILVVSIVYNIILRSLWAPQGLQKIADELLHVVVPLLYVLYWFFFVPKGFLKWTTPLGWLVYPFCYLAYSIIRGAITKYYPYPVIDVNKPDYAKAFFNAGLMYAGFLILGLLFVGIDKLNKAPVEK